MYHKGTMGIVSSELGGGIRGLQSYGWNVLELVSSFFRQESWMLFVALFFPIGHFFSVRLQDGRKSVSHNRIERKEEKNES